MNNEFPPSALNASESADLICFSHLRWDFVFQRPQHLLTRAARSYRVFFWEEPEWLGGARPHLRLTHPSPNIGVVLPVLANGMSRSEAVRAQRRLLHHFMVEHGIIEPLLWYY